MPNPHSPADFTKGTEVYYGSTFCTLVDDEFSGLVNVARASDGKTTLVNVTRLRLVTAEDRQRNAAHAGVTKAPAKIETKLKTVRPVLGGEVHLADAGEFDLGAYFPACRTFAHNMRGTKYANAHGAPVGCKTCLTYPACK
jgi:hypothetical protein